MRVTRVVLKRLGLSEDLVMHGINREVFVSPLADNYKEYLRGEIEKPNLKLFSAEEIGKEAVCRWVKPRSKTTDNWKEFRKESLLGLLPNYKEKK